MVLLLLKTSLDRFVAPMTSQSSDDVINYLTLDLDQPADDLHVGGASCHHGVAPATTTSATVYGDIDWFRTHALSDTRRQLETNRKNSAGSGVGGGGACI